MTRAATPEELADHQRDLRKHDTRPKRMPADAVEANTLAMICRGAGKAEQMRQRRGTRPITLAPMPASWNTKEED